MSWRSPSWSAGILLALLLAAGCREEGPPRPHLVLITVDTLRADRIGVYGSALPLTPNVDRLAAASTRFTAAYAAAPFTLASVSAFLTGRYPEELGVVSNATVLPEDATTLAEWLGARGWRTGAVVSNFVLRPESGLDAGFDVYDATFPQLETNRPVPERIAGDTTTAALARLDALADEDDPVFLWVHYQDPHGPYTPPGDLRERYLPAEAAAPDGKRVLPVSPTDRGIRAIPRYQLQPPHRDVAHYRAGYDGEVAYLDQEIGRLLDGIAERLPPAETVIAFTADHGESLGEDDYWFAHGEYLSDALVRVPLLLQVPGRAPAVRDDVASLVDLVPTLAELLADEVPPGVRGRDLLAPGAAEAPGFAYLASLRDALLPRFGIVRDGVRYVAWRERGEQAELIAPVRGGATPAAEPGALAAELTAFRATLGTPAPREQDLSPEEREQLRALGYLHGDD